MAAVRIENSAWDDPRYVILAKLCGFADPLDALIRCARVWSYCTDRCSDSLTSAIIDAHVRHDGFAEKMVSAELAEPVGDGRIRVRGAAGRIEWLEKKRQAGSKGGDAKARGKQTSSTTRPMLEQTPSTPLVVLSGPPTLCSSSAPAKEEEEALTRSTAAVSLEPSHVAAAWHREAVQAVPGGMWAEHAWRRDYETVAAVLSAVDPEGRDIALRALCAWFWRAPDGPVGSGRVKASRANPGLLAKRVTTDLEAAHTWWRETRHAG